MPMENVRFDRINRSKKDTSTQYVFIDPFSVRNLEDERNVSGEFHRMMRCQKVTDETFETGFIKRFAVNNPKEKNQVKDSNLSMIVDVDSSECSSDNSVSQVYTIGTSIGNGTSVINVTFDSYSETLTTKTVIKEYVKCERHLTRTYLSQSYDNLIFKFERASNVNETYILKKNRRYSDEDLKSFLSRTKYESSDENTFKYSTNSMEIFPSCNFLRENKKKRKKILGNKKKFKPSNKKLDESVDIIRINKNSNGKRYKQTIFRRLTKYLGTFFRWKCVSNKENVSIQTDDNDYSKSNISTYADTGNLNTLYQVSIDHNGLSKPECSRVSNIFDVEHCVNKDKSVSLPSRHLYSASLSYPFRKWFRMNSRTAFSTGALIQPSNRTQNMKIEPRFIEFPDRRKLIDISRAYYPLTKWTLINRFFRQKQSSERLSKSKDDG